MSGFVAIYKRELNQYFGTIVGYVAIAVILAFGGYPFSIITRSVAQASQRAMMMQAQGMQQQLPPLNYTAIIFGGITQWLTTCLVFIIPFLTMRLFAEEKKQGTMELLLTYPLRDTHITLGKYFAALTFFVVMIAPTLLYMPVASYIGMEYHVPVVLVNYLGLFLMGAAYIALGMWCSSMTENQIIAAALSLGIGLFCLIAGFSVAPGTENLAAQIVRNISLTTRLEDFGQGVIDTGHVVYYLSFAFVFIFLTLRTLESKKWRG